VASSIEVFVPDIGGFTDVSVIDVMVEDGQLIEKETPLITLETEKAAMDVPAPEAGRIKQVKIKRGDKVSQGSLILLLEASGAGGAAPSGAAAVASTAAPAAAKAAAAPPAAAATAAPPSAASVPAAASAPPAAAGTAPAAGPIDEAAFSRAYASPSIRKFAREIGVDLGKVVGTGPKQRITIEDVKATVKRLLAAPPPAAVSALPRVAEVDFAKFGPVEVKPLLRIQRISGARLQASWINVPHVTQHEEADITALEAIRVAQKDKAAQEGVRLTPLAFIVKACVLALKEFPSFNASLDSSGENLVYKKYYHIGFAADTPNGLVVPVIRDVDRSSLYDIARSLATLSEKARAGKLTAAEMQGGTFTISSLGGIGGTAFTPIINAPEVAILGVSRSGQKPVWEKGLFVPRLMLPLSLSYDHRVIDGAAAARFIVHLSKLLGDPQALLW
jgi:pyruvate dehydrogenase E2 component (dihydrolipoyllysine-residue acetyltransferase)